MASIENIIESRIFDCKEQAKKYQKWLDVLKIPNVILVGGGSLLAFLGGAAIVAEKWKEVAGFMALCGGALTGLHGWFGCEAHQQKCRNIASRYSTLAMKYEKLKYLDIPEEEKSEKFNSRDEEYLDFVEKIDARPWI